MFIKTIVMLMVFFVPLVFVNLGTREFSLPYNFRRTFVEAIWDHVKMLRQLGKPELVTVKAKG